MATMLSPQASMIILFAFILKHCYIVHCHGYYGAVRSFVFVELFRLDKHYEEKKVWHEGAIEYVRTDARGSIA